MSGLAAYHIAPACKANPASSSNGQAICESYPWMTATGSSLADSTGCNPRARASSISRSVSTLLPQLPGPPEPPSDPFQTEEDVEPAEKLLPGQFLYQDPDPSHPEQFVELVEKRKRLESEAHQAHTPSRRPAGQGAQGEQAMKLIAGLLGLAVLVGVLAAVFLAGFFVGRYFPRHHYVRFGETRVLFDTATGKFCNPGGRSKFADGRVIPACGE